MKLKEAFAGAIRDVQPGDIDAIMAIEESCFPAEDAYPRDMLQGYIEVSAKTPLISMLIAAPDSNAKGPAGYILGEMMPGRLGEISSLAVTKPYAGRGLGRALLDRVCKSLQEAGAKELVLQVEIDNASAIHLYKTSGFVQKKILPGYYSTGDRERDGIEMVKPVKKLAAKPLRP